MLIVLAAHLVFICVAYTLAGLKLCTVCCVLLKHYFLLKIPFTPSFDVGMALMKYGNLCSVIEGKEEGLINREKNDIFEESIDRDFMPCFV